VAATDVPVFILAGGKGERLAGATGLPKPLVPVGGRPFLGYLLDALARAGAKRVGLLTGYRSEIFPDALAGELALHPSLEVLFLPEDRPLGTGGALHRIRPFVERRALVLNGDSYCSLDLRTFLDFQTEHAEELALAAVRVADARDYGRLRIAEDGRLNGFEEKGAAGEAWVNAGIYAVPRVFLEEAVHEGPASLEREILPAWVACRPVWAWRTEAWFCDIGTPERWERACRELPAAARAAHSA